MRIYIKIYSKNKTIPFDHQHLLTGTIHKWLGWNEEHGNVSLYSFSRLEGATVTTNGLLLEKESSFFFSSYDSALSKKIIKGIQADNSLFNDLTVDEIMIQENPDLSNRSNFYVASPIFIKRKVGEKLEHIRYTDIRANDFLIETLQTKMKIAGIIDPSLSIRFDLSSANVGTKMIRYNGVQNRANWCPVIIEGTAEAKLFAWNVGLGNSTGIGFGAIK